MPSFLFTKVIVQILFSLSVRLTIKLCLKLVAAVLISQTDLLFFIKLI